VRAPVKGRNSRHEKRQLILTELCASIQELAQQLDDVNSRLEEVEIWIRGDLKSIEQQKKRRGPASKIDDSELFARRDAYVLGLETVWRDLEPRLFKARSPRAMQAVLEEFAPRMPVQERFQRLILDTANGLHAFINSGRLRKTVSAQTKSILGRAGWDKKRVQVAAALPTRQLANAIAGLPQIAWPTSLDRCRKPPSPWPIREPTELYYGIITKPRGNPPDAGLPNS
jgi:hypothetical protein